jgi:2-polyprenyl-3-methyl-5-hydroxy-6-metoxy-1,4-benzoquinol methylase
MNHPLNRLDMYASPVNRDLIQRSARFTIQRLLDVGAGTGSNLLGLKQLHPEAHTVALTCSAREAEVLQRIADQTITADLNRLTTQADWQQIGLDNKPFDLIVLSHVLEHLQEPAQVLTGISTLLAPKGQLLIALPNVCHWRTRLQILQGQFRYQDAGVLDRSHLRFFTYWTAVELIVNSHDLEMVQHAPVGGAILGPLRKLLPQKVSESIDRITTRIWPNLFGYEIHILAKKKSEFQEGYPDDPEAWVTNNKHPA